MRVLSLPNCCCKSYLDGKEGYPIYIYIYIYIYKVQLKSSLANQGTHMEFDQMKFIFQNSPLCYSYNMSIDVAVL